MLNLNYFSLRPLTRPLARPLMHGPSRFCSLKTILTRKSTGTLWTSPSKILTPLARSHKWLRDTFWDATLLLNPLSRVSPLSQRFKHKLFRKRTSHSKVLHRDWQLPTPIWVWPSHHNPFFQKEELSRFRFLLGTSFLRQLCQTSFHQRRC